MNLLENTQSFAIFCCFVIFGGGSSGLGAAFAQLHDDDNLDLVKFAVMTRGFGFLCGLFFNLSLSHHLQLEWYVWVIIWCCLLSSIATVAMSYVDTSYWLLLTFFQGFGFSSCDAVGNEFLLVTWHKITNDDAVGHSWVHFIHAGFTLGGLVGPALVGLLGYSNAFIIMGLSIVVPFCLLIISSFLSYVTLQKVNFSDSAQMLLTTHDDPEDPEKQSEDISTPPRIVYLMMALFFCFMGQEIAFSSWTPTYALVLGITDSYNPAAYLNTAFYAAMLFGRIVMSFSTTLNQMKNGDLLNRFIYFQIVASTLLIIFVGVWYAFHIQKETGYILFMVLTIIFGLSVNSLISMGINITNEYDVLRACPKLIVKIMIGLSFGEVIIPIIFGLYLPIYMVLMFLLSLVITVLYLYFCHSLDAYPTRSNDRDPLIDKAKYEGEDTN